MTARTISGLPTRTNREKTDRRQSLRTDQRQVDAGAEIDEEKEQQEIAQPGQAGVEGVAIGGRGQRDAGQEGPDLLAEAEELAGGAQDDRPGDGEERQHLLRGGQAPGQGRDDLPGQENDQAQECKKLAGDDQNRPKGEATAAAVLAPRRSAPPGR